MALLTPAQKKTLAALSAKSPEELTNAEKKTLDELKERQAENDAESMQRDNTGADDATEKAHNNDVFVFANLPQPQSFKLADGTTITIAGMAVSRLKTPDGAFFPGGKYGVTPVNRDAWAEIMRTYGEMKMFKSRIIFAADTVEEGKARARELGGLRHGYEPVDVTQDRRVKSSPDDGKG